jgi:threonine synthase
MYSSMVVRNASWRNNKIENPAIIAVVPSGNFGNLTSGLIAREMGAPIAGFVAATNSNRTIPDWIATGDYNARPSVETYANAMDVGAPSNYERIKAMYTLDEVRNLFASYWLDNDGILASVKDCFDRTGYTIDPHGAVGWKAWSDIRNGGFEKLASGVKNDPTKPGLTPNLPAWSGEVLKKNALGIILETAHPAKFSDTVAKATGRNPVIPDRLERVLKLEDRAIPMENDYNQFKEWLLANL